uniref:Trichohyalin-like n=1 Tax=Rhabditophanes sp. KR3021 TaxID=114890 RepID=A0AC35U7J2_9BILA
MRRHKSLEGGNTMLDYYGQPNDGYLEQDSNKHIPPPVNHNIPPTSARYSNYGRNNDNVPLSYYGMNNDMERNSLYDKTKKIDREYEMLKNDYQSSINRMNQMSDSIKSFWSPELKRERELRKDEHYRAINLQNQMSYSKMNQGVPFPSDVATTSMHQYRDYIPNDMSYRNLGMSKNEMARDFTDKSLSNQEMQTIKMKMEKSEIELAQKKMELNSLVMRSHQYEDMTQGLGKKVEIMTKDVIHKDGHIQLLQDDLNALREKLEIKNQQIEHKECVVKQLEKEIDRLKNEIADFEAKRGDGEHKNAQLRMRFEQLERLIREKDTELSDLKIKVRQIPSVKAEAQLQQLLENSQEDNKKLVETIEVLRKGSEVEKQQQLVTFDKECQQQTSTIDFLKKELDDREIMLVSQNKKISELNSLVKTYTDKEVKDGKGVQAELLQKQIDEARLEVDKLLKMIQVLEKDKNSLIRKLEENGVHVKPSEKVSNFVDGNKLTYGQGEQSVPMQKRISELEEALRESVGITADKEQKLIENKKLILQLSYHIEEYRKAIQRLEKATMDNANSDHQSSELMKLLEEERKNYLNQLLQLKRESLIGLLNEKENCIKLLEMPKDQVRVHLDALLRDRKRLQLKLDEENEMQQIILRPPGVIFDNAGLGMGNPTQRLGSLDWRQSNQNINAPIISNTLPNLHYPGSMGMNPNSLYHIQPKLHQSNLPANQDPNTGPVFPQDDGIWT